MMYAIYVERDGEMVVYDTANTSSAATATVDYLLDDGEKRVEVVEQ